MTKSQLKAANKQFHKLIQQTHKTGEYFEMKEEHKAVLLSLNSIAKESGWKKKDDDSLRFIEDQMILERSNEKAKITVNLTQQEQTVSITLTHKINLTDPKSLEKFHRILKGTRKVNKKK